MNDNTVEHILNSGTFNSYEKIISLDTNDIRVYITDNCDPTDVDNRDIDDRNIFVKHESDAYYLFVKLCKCADVEKPGDALYFINMNDGESTVKLVVMVNYKQIMNIINPALLGGKNILLVMS